MCQLAHVIRYTVLAYHKIFIFFPVLERWLIHDYETDGSCVYWIL